MMEDEHRSNQSGQNDMSGKRRAERGGRWIGDLGNEKGGEEKILEAKCQLVYQCQWCVLGGSMRPIYKSLSA